MTPDRVWHIATQDGLETVCRYSSIHLCEWTTAKTTVGNDPIIFHRRPKDCPYVYFHTLGKSAVKIPLARLAQFDPDVYTCMKTIGVHYNDAFITALGVDPNDI